MLFLIFLFKMFFLVPLFLYRMLSISQDGLNIKEKELNDCHMKINELQELLDEQQWNLKEKAARVN